MALSGSVASGKVGSGIDEGTVMTEQSVVSCRHRTH
jgi:hypothetical protein